MIYATPRSQRVARNRKWKKVADCTIEPPLPIDRGGRATDAVRLLRRHLGSRRTVTPIHQDTTGCCFRHVVTKDDVGRFVRVVPDWDAASHGLRAICLAGERHDCDGWYNEGELAVCAWPRRMTSSLEPDWYFGHRRLLDRIGADIDFCDNKIVCRWTDKTARAYLLLHVFLHELGHHVDRLAGGVAGEFRGGEGWAERFAFEYEALTWERYIAEFGQPW